MTRIAMLVVALGAAAVFGVAAGTTVPDRAVGMGPNVRLEFRYDDRGSVRKSASLTCRASGNRATGYLRKRDVRRLCRVARDLRDFLATPPQHEMCTELWGGPDRARVTGRIGADEIDRRLARNDGCEIDDWNRTQPLLPKPRGASRP
jgi:hypothetical protein